MPLENKKKGKTHSYIKTDNKGGNLNGNNKYSQ